MGEWIGLWEIWTTGGSKSPGWTRVDGVLGFGEVEGSVRGFGGGFGELTEGAGGLTEGGGGGGGRIKKDHMTNIIATVRLGAIND